MAGKKIEAKCPYLGKDHKECPAKEKCPHFEKIKAGDFEGLDFANNECPLKDKCVYYKEFLKDPSALRDWY
jgi:hypothetical protein